MRYRFILLMLLLLIINTAVAQWHYVITSQSFNSDCNNWGASLYVLAYEQAVEQWAIKTYSSQEECETARSNHAIINYSSGGCYARVTSTPCQGNASGGSGGASGLYYGEQSLYNAFGSNGYTFSPTERDINQNTYEELLMRMEALGYNSENARNFNPNKMSAKTGDDDFDNEYIRQIKSLNNKDGNNNNSGNSYNLVARNDNETDGPLYVKLFDAPTLDDDKNRYGGEPNIDKLNEYLSLSNDLTDAYLSDPRYLEQILQKEFERVSGYNVKDILDKHADIRTDEEKQILYDYGAFKTNKVEEMYNEIQVSIDNSPEKKEIDAAILALDVYGDDEEGYLNQTNYKKLDIEAILSTNNPSVYDPINVLSSAIKSCNDMDKVIGFKAELYYNEITNTYVISFAGTEIHDFMDFVNDAKIVVNLLPKINEKIPQYEEALSKIAKVINDIPDEERTKFNLEVVGHSLGGGLASIIGLKTGLETKTFNAATVPDNYLQEHGLYDKVKNGDVQNITAYHTTSDVLTVMQETFGSPAIGISIDIGNSHPDAPKHTLEPSGDVAFNAVNNAVNSVSEHFIKNVVTRISNSNAEKKKSEWDKKHDAIERLQGEIRNAEMWKK